jgi:hypothetical protein
MQAVVACPWYFAIPVGLLVLVLACGGYVGLGFLLQRLGSFLYNRSSPLARHIMDNAGFCVALGIFLCAVLILLHGLGTSVLRALGFC